MFNRISMTICVLICGGLLTAAPAAKGKKAAEQGLYVKKDTWAETMTAGRENYLAWLAETPDESQSAKFKPFDSGRIRGDAPARKVTLDVSGLKVLRLVTLLEEGVGNLSVWGEATLVAKDGAQTRLSALKPLSVNVGWGQLCKDKNYQNKPLQIGKQIFKHGIWVHTDSEVCYALNGKYERFEVWIGMDAGRATGAARFKLLSGAPDVLTPLWQRIEKDFPTEAKWLAADAGKNRQLDWFRQRPNVKFERGVLNRVSGALGPAGKIAKDEIEKLSAKAAPGAADWLTLYARTGRARELQTAIEQVRVAELRQTLEQQTVALLEAKTPAESAQWRDAQAKVETFRKQFEPLQDLDVKALRTSVDALAKALPGRFPQAAKLRKELTTFEGEWGALIETLLKDDATARKQLPALAEKLAALRRDIRLGLRGVPEFLGARSNQELDLDLAGEWENRWAALQRDIKNRGEFDRVAAETYRPDALILAADRDPADVILRRTAALLIDVKHMPGAPKLDRLERELVELAKASKQVAVEAAEARYAVFADASRLRRQIAFANPLLNFDEIVFIKRHRALFNHMCDQYYGMAATPGGGLYVLSGAFGPNPKVRDVLAKSVVQRGRLKGEKLDGGSTTPPALRFDGDGNLHGPEHKGGTFLSPDLSWDGQQIAFAYVENVGDTQHRHHVDPAKGHWAEGRCYHVFKVNVDGSGLERLTDGTWNDFDPCFLPNGRIAFISERRGGYLRCGRVCPTYTMFDMAADGADITCLSFHETNEWQPSVTNEGLIVWTRWDYIDRHGCTAHMPWVTTLDGRDPRAVHGNFSPRPTRPDMELDVRAIPDSRKLVAIAAPHHGQAYGSIVLVDPRAPDDDGMGPVKRVTPDVKFPESQGGAQVYGTPWALSEDYHLCVYDASMQSGGGRQGQGFKKGNYGIYLVDSFGNKELIYRDPEIACLSPLPLRARPMPHVAPQMVQRGPETDPAKRPPPVVPPQGKQPTGTVAVVNVYDSIKDWPEGTRIKELRVLQVLPMTVPSGGLRPHETGVRVASAGDSVVPVRYVLGTVPVEADGSAHFTVPANKEIFFQAIDQNGLAVQSMRSATHLQEGDRLVCGGCHTPREKVADASKVIPLAMRREPSDLKPDVDGTYPFSYPRLVQPVLDKNCVPCHTKEENKAKAPNLAREPISKKWYASYNSLTPKFGFYNYGDGYRTTPGQFGAYASKLYQMLEKGHHEVKLSPEDMHRIALWLDCSSMFYGVYEKEGGEAQLRGEIAMPTLE